MIQQFTVPGRLCGLNEYVEAERINRFLGAKVKREQTDIVRAAIKAAGLYGVCEQIDLVIIYAEPNMKRDKDNVAFAKKFILDALVNEGIIPNDGWRWVGHISEHFIVSPQDPHVTVGIMSHQARRTVTYMPITGKDKE